jgi:plasmid replication initiation protein
VNQDNKKETESTGEISLRSFTYANEEDDDWLTCGFINYAHIKRIAEIQVSHKLMPFLVELSSQYTAYSLRGNVLKKNGVKCTNFAKKWQGTDGFRISVDELRRLLFWKKYNRYALLNERVLKLQNEN